MSIQQGRSLSVFFLENWTKFLLQFDFPYVACMAISSTAAAL